MNYINVYLLCYTPDTNRLLNVKCDLNEINLNIIKYRERNMMHGAQWIPSHI